MTRVAVPPKVRREIQTTADRLGVIDRPRKVWDIYSPYAEQLDREHIWLVTLDIYARYGGSELLGIGLRDRVSFELPDALAAAAALRQKYIVLIHNHPSGYAYPSSADMKLTDSMAEACAYSGFLLIDHVILAPPFQFYTFREGRLCEGDDAAIYNLNEVPRWHKAA